MNHTGPGGEECDWCKKPRVKNLVTRSLECRFMNRPASSPPACGPVRINGKKIVLIFVKIIFLTKYFNSWILFNILADMRWSCCGGVEVGGEGCTGTWLKKIIKIKIIQCCGAASSWIRLTDPALGKANDAALWLRLLSPLASANSATCKIWCILMRLRPQQWHSSLRLQQWRSPFAALAPQHWFQPSISFGHRNQTISRRWAYIISRRPSHGHLARRCCPQAFLRIFPEVTYIRTIGNSTLLKIYTLPNHTITIGTQLLGLLYGRGASFVQKWSMPWMSANI
jgi:hypothetical protein